MQPQEPNPQQSDNQFAPAAPAVGEVIHPAGNANPVPDHNSVPSHIGSTQEIQPAAATPSQQSPQTAYTAQPTLNSETVATTSDPAPSFSAPTVLSSSSMQEQEGKQKRGFKFKPSKKLAFMALAVLLLGAASAGAYFGYFVPNKPANVWRTALTNTQKGYGTLTSYATSKKNVKGLSATGSFKLSGPAAVDGSFKGQSDGKNGELSGSTSAVGAKIDYDVRAIASTSGNTPDIYFKLDGLQDLGSLVGQYISDPATSKQVSTALNGLNGQWYFIDHSLFDQFAQGSNNSLQFSSADVSEILNAVGNANKQYLFTGDPTKMAVVVKQYVGKEKQDSRSVYHYKIGVNKANLDAYSKTLCGNLVKTKLFKTFEASSVPDQDLIKQCHDSIGLGNVDTSRTAEAWVDLHTKLIHKIRFTDKNNKNTYTDISQDYQGGNVFPFSIGTHSSSDGDTQQSLFNMKLDTQANTFSLDGNFSDSSSKADGTFKLNVSPSNSTVKVDKPAGAKTIIQLMDDLGLGSLVTGTSSGAQTTAKDAKRRTDLNALQSQLEVYFTDNGFYPTLANLNDPNWRKTNMSGFDSTVLQDPDGTQQKLVALPQAKAYSYQTTPANCTNSDPNSDANVCQSYTLTATLDNGTKYTKQSLN